MQLKQMELGADIVPVNTAIAVSGDPVAMAKAILPASTAILKAFRQ